MENTVSFGGLSKMPLTPVWMRVTCATFGRCGAFCGMVVLMFGETKVWKWLFAAAVMGALPAIPSDAAVVDYNVTYEFSYTVSPPGTIHPDQLEGGFPVFDYDSVYRDTLEVSLSWDEERSRGDMLSLSCSFQPYNLCTKFSYGNVRDFDPDRGTLDLEIVSSGAWHYGGFVFERRRGKSEAWFSFDPETWGSEYCFPRGYEDGSACADPTFILSVKDWRVSGLLNSPIYPAPLPASLPLLGAGLIGMKVLAKRRRSRNGEVKA